MIRFPGGPPSPGALLSLAVALLCLLLSRPAAGDSELFLFPGNSESLAALPKLVAQNLQNLDQDSSCWKQIQSQLLPANCQQLGYEQRGRLSFALTECYLRESGITIPSCPDTAELRSCTEAISHHGAGFSTYTAFFTSADAICQHFQHSSFAEAVELAIRQLLQVTMSTRENLGAMQEAAATASGEVLDQLANIKRSAEQQAAELLNHTELFGQTLSNQRLMIRGQEDLEEHQRRLQVSLSSFSSEFEGLFAHLTRLQTQAQIAEDHIGRISGDIGRLLSLQQSTLRAVISISSSAFYVVVFVLTLLATMLWKRAQGARLPLLLEIMAFIGLERFLTRYAWTADPSENVDLAAVALAAEDQMVVIVRRIFLVVATLTVTAAIYRYEDSASRLLQRIRRNGQLLKRLINILERSEGSTATMPRVPRSGGRRRHDPYSDSEDEEPHEGRLARIHRCLRRCTNRSVVGESDDEALDQSTTHAGSTRWLSAPALECEGPEQREGVIRPPSPSRRRRSS